MTGKSATKENLTAILYCVEKHTWYMFKVAQSMFNSPVHVLQVNIVLQTM